VPTNGLATVALDALEKYLNRDSCAESCCPKAGKLRAIRLKQIAPKMSYSWMFENRSKKEQNLFKQLLIKKKSQHFHKRNGHWETRQASTFATNQEMIAYKTKKDRT
jgi:hypothetical protein